MMRVRGYFGAGKVRLGWWLEMSPSAAKNLVHEWPFASFGELKGETLVRLPFPILGGEWKALKRYLDQRGLSLPAAESILVEERILPTFAQRLVMSEDRGSADQPTVQRNLTMPLFGFQASGVDYCAHAGWRALIGDDMGLGKTIQALDSVIASNSPRAVVVTRAVALRGWRVMAQEGIPNAAVQILRGRKPGEGKKPVPLPADTGFEGILLLNYEILDAWREEILRWKPDLLVLDEVHNIKEPASKRSVAAYAMMDEIDKVLALSGTPMPNRPRELYYILDRLHPGRWGDFFSFAKRYCDAKQVVVGRKPDGSLDKRWDFDGASRLGELNARLRASVMVRRRKEDVLSLPPSREQTFTLDASSAYRKLHAKLEPELDKLSNPDTKNQGMAALEQLLQAAADEKLPWLLDYVKAFLEDSDEKLVIFFHRQRIGDAFAELLKKMGVGYTRLYGNSPEKGGDLRFQAEADCRVSLCSYGVAREAVTLTKAAFQLFAEYTWVPGWMAQAMDRTNRIGQSRSVLYTHTELDDSAETLVIRSFTRKQDIVSVIMDGKAHRRINVGKGRTRVASPGLAM